MQVVSQTYVALPSPKPSYPVSLILNFVAHMAIKVNHVSAATIRHYIFPIRHHLQIRMVDVSFFGDPLIGKAVDGADVTFQAAAVQAPNMGERQKIPFTLDMIMFFRDHMMDVWSMADKAMLMGMLTQYVALLRRSEFIPTAEDHYLRFTDVSFGVRLSGGVVVSIQSSETHFYSLNQVVDMKVIIRSRKNDQKGNGMVLYWARLTTSSPGLVFDVVKEFFSWSQQSANHADSAFISFGKFPGLDYEGYNKLLKKVAVRMDIDPSRISSHCVRVAGASALQHAGVSDSIIMEMGGWKSLAFLRYIRISVQTMTLALTILLNPKGFSSDDVAKTQVLRPPLMGRKLN